MITQQIKQLHIKNIEIHFMGACLIIAKDDRSTPPTIDKTDIGLNNIQIQIQEELRQSSKIIAKIQRSKDQKTQIEAEDANNNSPMGKELNDHGQSLKESSNSKIMENNKCESAQKICQRRFSGKRVMINEGFGHKFLKKSSFRAIENSEGQSIFSQNYQGKGLQRNNIGKNFVETPFNRMQYLEQSMIGKGLANKDNELINSTLTANEPIKITDVWLKNKSVYSGQCFQGKKQGLGTLQWQDGSQYEGFWHDNKSEGKGKLQFASGQIYEGDWYQNKAEGNGIFTETDGSKYDGEWVNNMKQGSGIQIWKNGEKYIGMWSQGKKDGYGQLFFEDGSFYKGQFLSNQIHGEGIYYWKDQKTYKGQWQNNRMSGRGFLSWQKKGESYDGMFESNKMNGYGVFYFKNGSSSAGCWKNDRKNGTFIEKDSQGKISNVTWIMGKRLKNAEQKKNKVKFKNSKDSLNSKTQSSIGRSS